MLSNFFKFGFFNDDFFKSFESRTQDMKNELKDLKDGETKEIETTDENGSYSKKVISKGLNGSYSISTVYYANNANSLPTSKEQKLKALQADLSKAKEEERYEDCIKLREEIKLLE